MSMAPDLSKLPEDVRPFGAAVLRDYAAANESMDHDHFETLAWNRWAAARSNDQLADLLVMIRQTMVRPGRNTLESQLIEAAMRLRHPRKYGQRVRL